MKQTGENAWPAEARGKYVAGVHGRVVARAKQSGEAEEEGWCR